MANIRKQKGKKGIKWNVQVRLKGHKPISGTFDRYTEAKQWAEEVEDALRAGYDLEGVRFDDLSFEKALDRYLVEISPSKARNTRQREETAAKSLQRYFAPYTLKEITAALVATYRDDRLKTVTASTVRIELALLSHLYRIATMEWSLEVVNPVAKIRKPSPPRGRLRLLTPEEIDRLLVAAAQSKNKLLHPYLILQLNTGMRPSEGAGLQWEQVLLSEQVVDLTKTKTEPRRVALNDAAQEAIRIIESINGEKQQQWVFLPENPSQRLQHRPNLYFRRAFDNAVNRAKIKDFTMHDLRHTSASYLIMSGVDVRTLAEILGHKSMDMVQRYTHLLDGHKIAAVKKINFTGGDNPQE